jgi:hypothetical protein
MASMAEIPAAQLCCQVFIGHHRCAGLAFDSPLEFTDPTAVFVPPIFTPMINRPSNRRYHYFPDLHRARGAADQAK